MRGTDWAKTRLGSVERWPASLKNYAGSHSGQPLPNDDLVGSGTAQLLQRCLLSRFSRSELRRVRTDLSAMALAVIGEIRREEPNRSVQIDIKPGMEVQGNTGLLRPVLENLFRNAWKFTSKRQSAKIEFGTENSDQNRIFFVRDNGAGFEMEHAKKLFAPFQRLHHENEFAGTGIGLSIVRRIIHRHGGRIWAEGIKDGCAPSDSRLEKCERMRNGH